jgi:FdhD protein
MEPDWTIDGRLLLGLPARLREAQAAFSATGGLHAVGLFTRDGDLVAAFEDVGRHNAMDKLVGSRLAADALPLANSIVLLSGRASFELVQKAGAAGVSLLAAIGAPSSLAIELAEQAGITLVAFLRDGAFNIYTHGARLR